METSGEVLVLIQAESGEEIALPLAALDEQHQEVVLESDNVCDNNSQNGVDNEEMIQEDQDQIDESAKSPFKAPEVPRQKQKRKEKLVCLPLNDEDLELEFQIVNEPPSPIREEVRRKPRKEYRTKKKLAALEAAKAQSQIQAEPNRLEPAPAEPNVELQQPEQDKQVVEPQPTAEPSMPNNEHEQELKKEPEPDIKPQIEPQPHLYERRTRLTNACRVATGTGYNCINNCGFSTARINNIKLHIQNCPKSGKLKI